MQNFWRKLNYLIPGPDCSTKGNIITEWRDARPQPTDLEIDLVDINDVIAKEQKFPNKKAADIAALGTNRSEFIAEVNAMNSVADIKIVVRKLAELLYTITKEEL